MTGRMPEEGINPIELPPVAAHVWGWFLGISRGRQSAGMGGPQSLSSMEIHAYFQLEGFMPNSWELMAIRELDGVAMASMDEGKS